MEKIGYLGPVGTFTQEAALAFGSGRKAEYLEYSDIQGLITAVDGGILDMAVVPVENALEGTVNITVDMLVHDTDLNIVGEVILPICQCLLAPEGVTLDNIEEVISHPHALAQCRDYLYNHLRGVPVRAAASTAAGAREVRESGRPWAAIAHKRAAEVFNLTVLEENIQAHQSNSTRFIVLSHAKSPKTGCDKTSIAFTVDDSPGSLFHALRIFAENNINLKKIESRPMRTLLGQYLFLVDFEGHVEDERIREVLGLLSSQSKYFKLLGSYPRWSGE